MGNYKRRIFLVREGKTILETILIKNNTVNCLVAILNAHKMTTYVLFLQ